MNFTDEGLKPPRPDQLSYSSYLAVPDLLRLQKMVSDPAEHDEMLFILIHQVYELWFKQMIWELDEGLTLLAQDHLQGFLRILKRIVTIEKVLTHQVDILETMTPSDFNRFRGRLNPASGFQSYQFRLFEFKMGLKNEQYLAFYDSSPEIYGLLVDSLHKPSLYDGFLQLLGRRGFSVPKKVLARDVSLPYELNEDLKSFFLEVYQNPQNFFEIYSALELLVDIDQEFSLWRYRHVAMVQRMIGVNRGTGGSSGVKYLQGTLEKKFFPELWALRTDLGSQTAYS